MENSYGNLRKDIHKVFCDFFNREYEIQKAGEFDYEFMEYCTDNILRIIKNSGGNIDKYKSIFKNKKSDINYKQKTKSEKIEKPEILTINNLSNRAKLCLARNKIFTIKELIEFLENTNRRKSPLLKFKSCGIKTSNEIYDFLMENEYLKEK